MKGEEGERGKRNGLISELERVIEVQNTVNTNLDNMEGNNFNDNENLRRAVETARPIFLLDRLKRRGYRDVRRGKVDPE